MSTSPKLSSFSSQRPYSSSGLSDTPFSIGSHRWTRLLFFAVILYLTFLPLWWFALPVLAGTAGAAANWIYAVIDARVSIVPNGRIVTVFVSMAAGQTNSSGLRLDTVTYGLPLLAALVIVTRADSLLAKIRSLLLGSAVMIVLTILAVMAWARLATLRLDEELAHSGNRSSFLYFAFHGYAFSQPAVAVALWLGLMMLGVFRHQPKPSESPAKGTRRNARCPCGSGRKYKKCCGRAASR